jgi:hypothetical protein
MSDLHSILLLSLLVPFAALAFGHGVVRYRQEGWMGVWASTEVREGASCLEVKA